MSGPMTGALSEDATADSTGSIAGCGDFEDETPPPVAFAIEIRNVGAEAVLLNDPCNNRQYLQIQTARGWQWPGAFCRDTCQGEFSGGCIDCGACEEAAYTVIHPGATLVVDWIGVLFEDVAPPVECFESGPCAPTCPRARVPGSETLSMVVEAIRESDCVAGDPQPETSCSCRAGPEGWCLTSGQVALAPTLQATGEFTLGSGAAFVLELGG